MENKLTPKQALEEVRTFIPNTRQDSILVIEQALVEHEKQTQILEVLKKKEVDISYIKSCEDYFDYTMATGLAKEDLQDGEFVYVLTETEFNLIKEWLK